MLAGFTCYGQKGFLGKQHTILTDPFRYLHRHEIMVEYMYTPKTHGSIVLGLSRQNMVIPELETADFINFMLMPPPATEGEGRVKSTWISLAYMLNYEGLNMPMPLGYYYGYELAMRKSNVFDMEETALYNSRQYYLSFLFGRNVVIGKQFLLGFRIPFGFTFGRVNVEEHYRGSYYGTRYPADLPFFNWDRDFSYNTEREHHGLFAFYIFPSIKLGFMF